MKGARELFPHKKIIVIFQPHLYSRTKQHLHDFGTAFSDVDSVIIAPIYAAREPHDPSITSDMVAEEINANHVTALTFPTIEAIENHLKTNGTKDEVIITMGAGDIYKLGEKLVEKSVEQSSLEQSILNKCPIRSTFFLVFYL